MTVVECTSSSSAPAQSSQILASTLISKLLSPSAASISAHFFSRSAQTRWWPGDHVEGIGGVALSREEDDGKYGEDGVGEGGAGEDEERSDERETDAEAPVLHEVGECVLSLAGRRRSQGGWGYGFGSDSFECSDDFDDGVARADELNARLALRTQDGGRAESAFAGCRRLHVGDPVEETCFVCYQGTRARVSPDRCVGTIFTLI
ncbi:hypothetical protein KCU62_g275, partial [Aureobasidium sp. EXF-3399]